MEDRTLLRFASAGSLGVGPEPRFLVTDDFNFDGHADLAVVNSANQAGTVSVRLGRGDATFAPTVDYRDPSATLRGIAKGDFDEDGIVDLVVTRYGSTRVTLLFGNGDGTFQPVRYAYAGPFTGTTGHYWVDVGDMNNDGHDDIITTNPTLNYVSVIEGRGDGSFRNPWLTYVAVAPDRLIVRDLDADGDDDLAVSAFGGNTVAILLNTGDPHGGFEMLEVPVDTGPTSLAAEDFDHDGNLDLMVVTPNQNRVWLLRGHGGGYFVREPFPIDVNQTPNTVAVGDFDNDGWSDFAVTRHGGNRAAVFLKRPEENLIFFVPPADDPATGAQPTGVVTADFNGDGWLDLAVANRAATTVTILINQSDWAGPGGGGSGHGGTETVVGLVPALLLPARPSLNPLLISGQTARPAWEAANQDQTRRDAFFAGQAAEVRTLAPVRPARLLQVPGLWEGPFELEAAAGRF